MPSPTSRDIQRLKGVHPRLVDALTHILTEMEAEGAPMFIVHGLRTALEQAALYAKGRTTPGPNVRPGKPLGSIVTNKDGYLHKSNHQARQDGYGHAVDLAFVGPSPFSDDHPWEVYGLKVEAAGLKWGGRWTFPVDSPHAELP